MPSAIDDPDVDLELLEFMRNLNNKSLVTPIVRPSTKVLESAQFITDNSIDVHLSREDVVRAAASIYQSIQDKGFSTETWSEHELHPKTKDEDALNFIFTMDLLNFSFWSELPESKRFCVEYRYVRWTGYWSLVALLRRALDEGIPITCPYFWTDRQICTDELLAYVFRSETSEDIPLLAERINCLREAGDMLCERYDGSFANLLSTTENSAAALVVKLADELPSFRDEHIFEGRRVNLYKRAQILAADIWACFNGESYGEFHDIDHLTMFADYRVPQILNTMNCLMYSPKLEAHLKAMKPISAGDAWELQLRGASIMCVEMIRREIERKHPGEGINAVLIDFYLYDTAKEIEKNCEDLLPHHRTRSIWY